MFVCVCACAETNSFCEHMNMWMDVCNLVLNIFWLLSIILFKFCCMISFIVSLVSSLDFVTFLFLWIFLCRNKQFLWIYECVDGCVWCVRSVLCGKTFVRLCLWLFFVWVRFGVGGESVCEYGVWCASACMCVKVEGWRSGRLELRHDWRDDLFCWYILIDWVSIVFDEWWRKFFVTEKWIVYYWMCCTSIHHACTQPHWHCMWCGVWCVWHGCNVWCRERVRSWGSSSGCGCSWEDATADICGPWR